MDIQAATARARRTFAYRDDDAANNPDSDSDSPMALDEQEQESLIASLAAQNAARNAQFRLFLLLLPAFSALPYLLALLRGPAAVVVPVLGLSSLACTAWTLLALPPGVTGIAAVDAWVSGDNSNNNSSHNNFNNSNNTLLQQQRLIRPSPLETYLPYLNAALCTVLILLELAGGGGGRSAETETAQQRWGHVALGNLPAIVYVVVLAAKAVMGGVDPERELGALRYEYKGA